MSTRLYRIEQDKKISGVCSGLAHYLRVDPVFVRLCFIALAPASGLGVILYLVLWFVMPLEKDVIRNELADNETDPYKIKFNTPVMSLSVVLVIIGVTLLLSRLRILTHWGIWPLLLIVLGIWFYARRNQS